MKLIIGTPKALEKLQLEKLPDNYELVPTYEPYIWNTPDWTHEQCDDVVWIMERP